MTDVSKEADASWLQDESNLGRRSGGSLVTRIGGLVSLYFTNGHSLEKRKNLELVVSEYIQLFGSDLSFYEKPDSKNPVRWRGDRMPKYYKEYDLGNKNDGVYYSLMSAGDEPSDPGLHRILAFGFGLDNVRRRLSGIHAHFPPSFIADDPDGFVKLILGWCQRVNPVHGSGGFGVLTDPGGELTGEPVPYEFLTRYPGLDYDAMGSYMSRTSKGGYEKARTSNWLTIISDPNTAELGGRQAIHDAIAPGMSVYDFGTSGVLIRAGERPQLGGEDGNPVPPLYKVAAKIIRPVRFEDYKFGIIKVPKDLDSRTETLKWLRRFDD